jgi:hypothetical protein
LCPTHDQALIPIKTLAFDRGVNVTLGLPFVRTSPDHGTAFDIAGRGIANPSSMVSALRLAITVAGPAVAATGVVTVSSALPPWAGRTAQKSRAIGRIRSLSTGRAVRGLVEA